MKRYLNQQKIWRFLNMKEIDKVYVNYVIITAVIRIELAAEIMTVRKDSIISNKRFTAFPGNINREIN